MHPRAEQPPDFRKSLPHDPLGKRSSKNSASPPSSPWTGPTNSSSLVASSPRIAKHAHVPLQSGSDAVLRRMHRKYRPWHYREKIEKIRAAMPDRRHRRRRHGRISRRDRRRIRIHSPPYRGSAFYLSARLHLLRAPRHPRRSHAESSPCPCRARAQQNPARPGRLKKEASFMRSFIGKPLDAITLSAVTRNTPKVSPLRP